MIRVNLLRNKGGDSANTTQTSMTSSSVDKLDLRDTIVKLGLMAMFIAGLVLYENQNLHALQSEQARMQSQINEMQTEAAAKAKEADTVKDVEKQARELEDKLKILKLLSRLRLREVKTLDFMQNSIPEKVWLKTMTFDAEKDKPEAGRFNFTGNSATTEDLTEFVKRLEDSPYLAEVIVMKNQEIPTANQKGVMREFQFTAQVEVKP